MQSVRRTHGVPASPLVLDVLDRLASWTEPAALAAALDLPSAALEPLLAALESHDLVEVSEADDGPATGHALDGDSAWGVWSPAAWLFHRATRDIAFARAPGADPEAAGARPAPVLPPPATESVALPAPRLDGTLRKALQARRTHRRFADGAVTLADLGTLLGATFGVQAWVQSAEGPLALKTSPSGGARHSLEAYVWIRNVEGLRPGLCHYRGDTHALARLDDREPPATMGEWLPAQGGYERAAVVVVLASELSRVAWRYRSARALRVVLIESGHLAQTFCLVATALGLAPFCTAALADSAIEASLGLDGDVSPVTYAMGVGQPAAGAWRPHEDRPAPVIEITDLGRDW